MSRPLSPALQKLIASFKQALPEKFEEIKALHLSGEAEDTEALQTYYTSVHRLAGSAGSYGFPTVSKSARVLDRYLSDVIAGEKEYSAAQADSLLTELGTTITQAAAE
ncbi:MAG: Hpt domain-containing protein [Oceanococcus sp.]